MDMAMRVAAPGYLYALAWSLAGVVFSLCRPPKGSLHRRALIWLFCIALSLVVVRVTDVDMDALYFPTMFTILFLVYCLVFYTTDISKRFSLYLMMHSFLIGEWIGSMTWVLFLFGGERFYGSLFFLVLTFFFSLSLTLWLLWLFERHFREGEEMRDITLKELFSTGLAVLGIFLFSNVSNVTRNTPISGTTPFHISQIRALVDLGGLMLLVAARLAGEEVRRKNEAELLCRMMAMQEASFQVSEQSMRLIHQKYHDLKHQMEVFKEMAGRGEALEEIGKMEEEIRSFEAVCHTGNRVMDILVTNKALQCQSLGIDLTCMAEGRLLSFMSDMDLSALLGNLLDNAMEHVASMEQMPSEGKRWIQVNLRRKGSFILLEVGNPCKTPPVFRGGIPVSTKGDADYHGYGCSSVKRIAESYGGSVSFCYTEGWFEARVLLSQRKTEAA